MSDPEPPASDGQNEGTQSKNGGGSLSRLRTLLRLLRRPRGPRSSPRKVVFLPFHTVRRTLPAAKKSICAKTI